MGAKWEEFELVREAATRMETLMRESESPATPEQIIKIDEAYRCLLGYTRQTFQLFLRDKLNGERK